MSIALITGGLGFIGSHIARRVLQTGLAEKVVLLDSFGGYVDPLSGSFIDWRPLRFAGIEGRCVIERAQTQHFVALAGIVDRYRPSHIFHLAAMPLAALQNATAQEAVEGAVVSTSNLLTVCAGLADRDGYAPERVVYASSSMVYGDFEYSPADEAHPLRPRNIYGTMKLAGEACALGLARSFGLKATVVRPSAVYGPTDMNGHVSEVFLNRAIRGETLVIHGADETLDFTYVEDIAEGFLLAAAKDTAIGEVFNITAGRGRTLVEYAEALRKHFPGLRYEIAERDAARPLRGTLSIEKARAMIGYRPAHSLEEGLDKYVAFMARHAAFRRPHEPR